ncbi:hypothetical protein [Actinoplanes regularis]|uniref:hypothetical protein n=1 Tax=Actinoplanes regularis TaxID=52697 RepID=UPI0024A1F4AF|nr:hypothetical protein [Actinoplanes regularis]GLW35647.1 hypothetical protein Areg01_85820 [Actinoplanes regularis]
MPPVPRFRRRRVSLIAAATAALVMAIAAVVTLTASPAAAAWQTLPGTPAANCVLKNSKNNTYRAVYGYTATKAATIPAGDNNRLYLIGGRTQNTTATVTTDFEPGIHPATFATDWITSDTTVLWWVGGQVATATWNTSSCGNNITLPAAGNGAGPLVALLLAGVVAMFVLWRNRRKAA